MATTPLGQLFDFSGKSVIVTGGAMGIGYGIARRFAEGGARVTIADIDDRVGNEKTAELARNFNVETLFHHTDVGDEANVISLFDAVTDRFGSVDIVVNNAGIFPNKPVLDMDLSLWEKIQGVNLRGTFLMCREAGKRMAAAGMGNIVNVGSIDSLHPSMVGLAAYDASKHGMWGFTKNFALEVAKKNIRVNMIAPGGIATEGVAAMNQGSGGPEMEAQIRAFTAKIPLGRFGAPDDIATAALFLASPASSYMTGSVMVVDGGYLLT